MVDHNRQYAQVLGELENGSLAKTFTYGDDLVSQQAVGGQDSFYLYDGLGTTRALTDASGALSDEYFYEAFGELLASTGSTDNDYLFTGEQYDGDLEQYYLRARYYDPGVGRFTQMDTWQGRLQEPVTLHKYLYANADPANGIDPSGEKTIGELMTSLKSAATSSVRAVANYSRTIGTRAKNNTIKGVNGLRARIWFSRNVGRVQSRLPKELGRGQARKKNIGWRWSKKNRDVQIAKGDPKASFEAQRVDYIKITHKGKGIGRNGQVLTNKKGAEAHIPLREWLTWSKWYKP